MGEITHEEALAGADPIVVEADAAVRSILEKNATVHVEVSAAVYKILLLGAIGVLKAKGQPHHILARNLRAYAELLAPEGLMRGRRLPVTAADPYPLPELPGDYAGPIHGLTGDKPCVRFLKPNARDPGAPPRARAVQHVVSPPHQFIEVDDGSLTIKDSIGDQANGSESDGWHGYLTRGIWIKA